jgi:hypothetical protein
MAKNLCGGAAQVGIYFALFANASGLAVCHFALRQQGWPGRVCSRKVGLERDDTLE